MFSLSTEAVWEEMHPPTALICRGVTGLHPSKNRGIPRGCQGLDEKSLTRPCPLYYTISIGISPDRFGRRRSLFPWTLDSVM